MVSETKPTKSLLYADPDMYGYSDDIRVSRPNDQCYADIAIMDQLYVGLSLSNDLR